jgi:hypothetical protein
VEVIARGNEEGIGSLTREGGEGSIDLAVGAGIEDMDWEGDGTGSFLHLPQRGLGNPRVGRIKEHGYPNRFWLQLEQYLKPLGHDLLEEKMSRLNPYVVCLERAAPRLWGFDSGRLIQFEAGILLTRPAKPCHDALGFRASTSGRGSLTFRARPGRKSRFHDAANLRR